MKRVLVVTALALVGTNVRAESAYVPAPADAVTGYFAQPMPCKIVAETEEQRIPRQTVVCQDKLLEKKSLRELTIARNTIYARYGWDGYRKSWLRDHFHAQPWFKPNPKFSYKQLSDVDRKNAHFIGVFEQSLGSAELEERRDDIYARYGRIWDKPSWSTTSGKTVYSCEPPPDAE